MTTERDAHRQLLLTRIAVERVELAGDMAQLRRSANVARLLQLAVAPTLLGRLLSGTAAGKAPAAGTGWGRTAWALWQRWRRVAPVFGLLLPLLRRRRLRWMLLAGGLAGGVALAAWARKRPSAAQR